MNIIEQLAADRAEQDHRVKDKRRKPVGARHHNMSDLHRAFFFLAQLAYHEPQWSRDDLIRLVDLALAEPRLPPMRPRRSEG